MKTLLLRPFVSSSSGISPPLALMYLSSFLKSKHLDVKIIDTCADAFSMGDFSIQNTYIQNLVRQINDYTPDIIGIALFSSELKETAKLSKLLKNEFKSAFIVLGGPHPTAMPHETLEQIPECDFVIRGEGELILYDLIIGLSNNSDLRNIKGISFRLKNTNEICHCEEADVVTDLDSLPFPDREDFIHNYRNGTYGSLLFGSPSVILITGRGCPFQCHYCFKVCPKYRSRSAEDVLKEIEWIVNNISPPYIQIMDDSFTIQRNRCIRILDALIEKKYPCKFRIRSRVDAIDKELLEKMKQAGVDTIVYGLESGSQKMLDAFNKRTTVEQNLSACKLTRQAGLNCFADMMLFYPGENKETLKETESFIKLAKPTLAYFHMLSPLPKTKIYDEVKKDGRLVGDWDTSGRTPWVKLAEFENLEAMEQIAKKMLIRSLLSPVRIFWLMKSYGITLLKNPILSLKMILRSFWVKAKY